MKKIAANLALTGSLLMAAAVLAPLIHGFDQDQTLGLLLSRDQARQGYMATAEMATRADVSTGLIVADAGPVARFCAQGGQVTELVCATFAAYLPQD